MPRVSEVLYGVKVDGSLVKLDQIEGAEVVITGYGLFEAELGQACAIQMSREGMPCWLVTFSTVIMETLEKVRDRLPLEARFMSHLSASDRKYWTIE